MCLIFHKLLNIASSCCVAVFRLADHELRIHRARTAFSFDMANSGKDRPLAKGKLMPPTLHRWEGWSAPFFWMKNECLMASLPADRILVMVMA